MHASDGKGATGLVLPAGDDHPVASDIASPVDHGTPGLTGVSDDLHGAAGTTVDEIEESRKGWFAYFTTRNFWIVLVLG